MRVAPVTDLGTRVARCLVLATAAVVAASLVATAVNRWLTPIERWREFFDVRAERNLPTWWNASLLVAVAIGALAAGAFAPARGTKHAWWTIATAATYLSVDETTGLHERLDYFVENGPIDLPTYGWVLPGIILASFGVAALTVAGHRLPAPTAQRLAVALACYGTGAILIEAINGWLDTHNQPAAVAAGSTIEESLEMIACVYAVTTIIDMFAAMPTRSD